MPNIRRYGKPLKTDGWSDVDTGLGSSGKGQNLAYTRTTNLSDTLLDDLYEGDWLARRVVEKIVDLSLARGFKIQDMEEGKADELLSRYQKLNIARHPEGAVQRALYLGRLYGGGALILGYANGGSDVTKPVTGKPELAYLETAGRPSMEVPAGARYTDPTDAKFGLPELYKITQGAFQNVVFHETRLIRTSGLSKVTELETPEWSLSVLQPVACALARYGLAWESVSNLLQEASIGVMKIAGLIAMIGAKDTDTINARADIINNSKTVAKTIFLDADSDESFTRTNVGFADVPEILAQIMQDVAGAVDMPSMILFGETPRGLNATGEGDLQVFYDAAEYERQQKYKPILEEVLTILNGGDSVTIEFEPLWEPTKAQVAETRLKDLQGDQILYTTGAVHGEEVVLARKLGQTPEEYVDESELEDRLAENDEPQNPPTTPAQPGFAEGAEPGPVDPAIPESGTTPETGGS